jgi:hypothetical protein
MTLKSAFQNPCLNPIKTKQDFQQAIQQAKKFEELENLMKKTCNLSKTSKKSNFL